MAKTEKPEVETVNPGIGWAFYYDGPIETVDDRNCEMCNAAHMGSCNKDSSRHGANYAACSTCHTAKIGYCPNHCGIEMAMNECEHSSTPDFELAMVVIGQYLKTLNPSDGNSRITVKMTSDRDRPNWGQKAQFSIQVDVK